MPDIEFPTSAGTSPGYLAVPAGERGPATIVLQEWWGLDEHVRSICDRFAAAGFFALAPDLYRGETTTEPSEAQQKMMALSMERGRAGHVRRRRLPAPRSPACEGTGVGSVGFCLGGGLSVWAAATCPNIAAAVTYYYVMPHGKPDFTKINGPVLGHFGTADEFIPVDDAEALERELREAGVDVDLPLLRGRRATPSSTTPTAWAPTTRSRPSLAWERTVSFLRAALAG